MNLCARFACSSLGHLCSFIALMAWANVASAVALSLGIGQQEALTFDSLAQSVSVDRSGIIDVSKGETKSVVVVTGKSEGSAELTVKLDGGKKVTYQITVSTSARNAFSSTLVRLRKTSGITVDQRNSKYMVSGQFRNRSDQLMLQRALRDFPGMLIDTTDPDIVESNAVVKALNRVLAENDIANIQAHAYGNIIALEGSPKDEMQKALALRIARMIFSGAEDHISTDSNGAPPIAIEVLFIESSKSNNKTYGIRGPQEAFRGDVSPKSGVVSASSTAYNADRTLNKFNLNWQVGSLSAFLRLEQTKGHSRVVSNPKLVTRSGQKATFESGGAFYIQQSVQGSDGTKTTTYMQQPTGIMLSIEPRIDAIGQIDSRIKTQIIDVADRVSNDAVPNLLKSNLETAVTIPNGQSIFLSGLTLKKSRKSIARVPLLADIPLIGELFKERNQMFEEKEVAVIVTMIRVAPSDNRAQVADQLLETSDNDVSFSFFD